MITNKCFLCNLLEVSRTRGLKSLFESKNERSAENKFETNTNHNACTEKTPTMTKQESDEDAKRSNNLIIFGIKESGHTLNESEQADNDKTNVKMLLMSLNIEANKVVGIKRLESKKHGISSRPILIKFLDYESRTKCLKKAKFLKDTIDFKNIAISPDYSKSRRLKIKLLIQTRIELNEQLRKEKPNASYYFSIKAGRIVMVNKQSEEKNSINDTLLSGELKTLIHALELIREEMLPVKQFISDLDSRVTNAEISGKELNSIVDNVARKVVECKNSIENFSLGDVSESIKNSNEALLCEMTTKLQIMYGLKDPNKNDGM